MYDDYITITRGGSTYKSQQKIGQSRKLLDLSVNKPTVGPVRTRCCSYSPSEHFFAIGDISEFELIHRSDVHPCIVKHTVGKC